MCLRKLSLFFYFLLFFVLGGLVLLLTAHQMQIALKNTRLFRELHFWSFWEVLRLQSLAVLR